MGYKRLFPVVLIACATLFVAAFLPRDGDTERYWLAQAGAQIQLVPFHVPRMLGPGALYPSQPWIDQEWLIAYLTAFLQSRHAFWIAIAGLGLCGAWLALFVFGECIRCRIPPLWTIVVLVLAVDMIDVRLQYRAEPFAFALFALTIVLWRSRRWWPATLIAICVWANVQSSVAIGLLWMTGYAVAIARTRPARLLTLPAALAAAAINPIGLRVLLDAPHLYAMVAPYATEWTSIYRTNEGPALLVVIACLVGIRALRAHLRRRSLTFERWSGAVALLTLAGPIRDIFPFAIFGMPWVFAWFRGGFTLRVPPRRLALVAAIMLGAVIAGIGYDRLRGLSGGTSVFGLPQTRTEAELAPMIERIPRGAAVFTDIGQAGSMLLFFGRRPTLDGRIEAYAAQGFLSRVAGDGSVAFMQTMDRYPERYAIVGARRTDINDRYWSVQARGSRFIALQRLDEPARERRR